MARRDEFLGIILATKVIGMMQNIKRLSQNKINVQNRVYQNDIKSSYRKIIMSLSLRKCRSICITWIEEHPEKTT